MDNAALTVETWFWLLVPLITIFVLSILNYLRSRRKEA